MMTSDTRIPPPTNSIISPLLTDFYQISMAYSYWKTNRHEENAVFELFFRKNPFGGEFTIFCGLDEVLKFMENFKLSRSDLEYLKSVPLLSNCESEFFDEYLANLDCSEVIMHSMKQGTVAFPRVPLMIISGPLGIVQWIETTLLNLVNYPSLVATNAARMVMAAKEEQAIEKHPLLIEFGLRRAQGPDGGFSASKYSFIGGFDGTSNVQAGNILGIPIAGTHAHSFIQSHSCLDDAKGLKLKVKDCEEVVDLLQKVLRYRNEMEYDWKCTNESELAAFIAYGTSFPDNFLCLIDTYDSLKSGLKNFILVALALNDCGYIPKGIRLDSGDLSKLSLACAQLFEEIAKRLNRPFLKKMQIIASNDINEDVLHSLNQQGHSINVFGIGTNLVTCQKQPALGCVYKLVELNGKARMKLSQDFEKVLIPGKKEVYRLFGSSGCPLLDLMIGVNESKPQVSQRIMCLHPFDEQKRVAVVPSRVEALHSLVFNGKDKVVGDLPSLLESKKVSANLLFPTMIKFQINACFLFKIIQNRIISNVHPFFLQHVKNQIKCMQPDIFRHLNPDQYKVSVSDSLFKSFHSLWLSESPVIEIH